MSKLFAIETSEMQQQTDVAVNDNESKQKAQYYAFQSYNPKTSIRKCISVITKSKFKYLHAG